MMLHFVQMKLPTANEEMLRINEVAPLAQTELSGRVLLLYALFFCRDLLDLFVGIWYNCGGKAVWLCEKISLEICRWNFPLKFCS